jgi:LmbE family N-acetylglucosaminyl deacetylase
MNRRDLLNMAVRAGIVLPFRAAAQEAPAVSRDVVVETAAPANSRKGKTFVLVTPHLDDGPIFAGGTLAKLLSEGCQGYFIRTSNDEKDSLDLSLGETVLANERDSAAFVRAMGLRRSFDLGYRNHRMDDVPRTEIRGRLIFLFRLIKADIVLSYDPWSHYEENPDHYVTAQAVEAACWMSGGRLDMPEHFAAGLEPHSVSEKYYFARGPQLVNRVVDIKPVLEAKMRAIESCSTMIGHMVGDLNAGLAKQDRKAPALSGDTANAQYIRTVFQERDRRIGRKYGLEFAEEFHYIGADTTIPDLFTDRSPR